MPENIGYITPLLMMADNARRCLVLRRVHARDQFAIRRTRRDREGAGGRGRLSTSPGNRTLFEYYVGSLLQ